MKWRGDFLLAWVLAAACADPAVDYTLPRLVVHGTSHGDIARVRLFAATLADQGLEVVPDSQLMQTCPCPDPLTIDVDARVAAGDLVRIAILAERGDGTVVSRHLGSLTHERGPADLTLEAPDCDADQDGYCASDPPPWSDPDDSDATRTPLSGPPAAELCDGLDNDQDGMSDEGLLGFHGYDLVIPGTDDWADVRLTTPQDGAAHGPWLASWTRTPSTAAGRCIRVAAGGQPPTTECTVLGDAPNGLPRYPTADLASSVLVGWVRTSGCARGIPVLGLAASLDAEVAGVTLDLAPSCDGTAGAAMPAVAISPADESRGIVAWRGEPAGSAPTPLSGSCKQMTTAPVELRLLRTAPDLDVLSTLTLGPSLSTRPPAILALPDPPVAFIMGAATNSGGAALTMITEEVAGTIGSTLVVPGLPEQPTGVSLALGHSAGAKVSVGVGLEVGCMPQQAWFTEVTFDRTTGERSIATPIKLDTGGGRASFVTAGWSEARGEWLVVYSGERFAAHRVRVANGAAALADPHVGVLERPGTEEAITVGAAGDGWVITFNDTGESPGIAEVFYGCPD